MTPSKDQISSAFRIFIATIGGMIGGWAISRGWITQDQASAILGNQELMSALGVLLTVLAGSAVSGIAGVWGVIVNREAAIVAAAESIPQVAKVEMKRTEAGIALAQAVLDVSPTAIVTVAGNRPTDQPLPA